MTWIWIGLGIWILVALLFGWLLCMAAKRGDEMMSEAERTDPAEPG